MNRLSLAYIQQQRILGWPDIHPEDYCHKCGSQNPLWYAASREQWLEATKDWATFTGREGICCPTCFVEMFNRNKAKKWILRVVMEELQ